MIYRNKEVTPTKPKVVGSIEPKFDPIPFLKRYWPYLAGGAVVVLLVSFGLFKFAVSGRNNVQAENNPTANTDLVATSTPELVSRRLDGVLVKPEDSQLLPWAVMVEMHPDARPLSGIAKASLVFEAPVEGGITRLMVVYDATTTVASVGPVRSARPYFVEWADALHAAYSHVGGSPEALNRIGGMLKFHNLDEFASGKYFWRDSNRAAPHNTYTSQKLVASAVQNKSWQPGEFSSWTYDDSTSTATGDYPVVEIPYGGSYNVRWQYDKDKDAYVRYQSGKIFKDADGSAIETKNILVMVTEQRVLDDVGRLYIRTAGSGKAELYRSGFKEEVRWSRSPGENLRVETTDGRAVAMNRGTTWIEVVTLAEQMPKALPVSSTTNNNR